MEFGDRALFSVQLELDADYGGSWLYGRFCYWVNGTRVGDYDLGTSMRDVFFKMKWVVNDCGNRKGGQLCSLLVEEAFLLLDKSLYGAKENAQESWLPDLPARFDVRPPVDVFDEWKMYLIECGDRDLMLYRNSNEVDVQVFGTPVGVFDTVIKQAYAHLENLYQSQVASDLSK